MRTLLNLFFLPYLKFLGKFNLFAIPVIAFVLLIRIQELMLVVPMLYMFALYSTSNRHQFKDNIPWMLATFNKKTLISYHLLSQTFLLLSQAFSTSVMMVGYFIATIMLAPELTDQVLPEMGSTSSKGAGAVLAKGISPLAGTKEQLVLLAVVIFFLITMYSPVALKEYLKQMEEKGGRKKTNKELALNVGLILAGSLFVLWAQPAEWMVIFLSFILVTEITYIIWIYNKAFVLFHPKHYKLGGVAAFGVMALMCWGTYSVSLRRYHSKAPAEVRMAELDFLGSLAPKIAPAEFTALAKEVKDPQFVLEFLKKPQFANLMDPKQLQYWVLEAKELGVAMRLVKALPKKELSWLEEKKVWSHLEKLYADLNEKNPASAQFQAKSLERHLFAMKWTSSQSGEGPFQKSIVMGLKERDTKRLPASSR
ncbi:MAG: hypothetical protein K2P81_07000 [Bacteriovoracaceae bacterium]|nr:hypothetical protein [Bacteriovoracaceae bacterium]